MSEAVLNEKVSYIVDKVENIESLITRRLLEDKEKNSLIEELKKHLIYRQELDKGAKFGPLMIEILKVMDRLKSDDITPSVEFITSVYEELLQVLSLNGLETIDNSGILNPSIHEVVSVVPTHDNRDDNQIVAVLEEGYLLNNRVLRPSKVIIAQYQPLG